MELLNATLLVYLITSISLNVVLLCAGYWLFSKRVEVRRLAQSAETCARSFLGVFKSPAGTNPLAAVLTPDLGSKLFSTLADGERDQQAALGIQSDLFDQFFTAKAKSGDSKKDHQETGLSRKDVEQQEGTASSSETDQHKSEPHINDNLIRKLVDEKFSDAGLLQHTFQQLAISLGSNTHNKRARRPLKKLCTMASSAQKDQRWEAESKSAAAVAADEDLTKQD